MHRRILTAVLAALCLGLCSQGMALSLFGPDRSGQLGLGLEAGAPTGVTLKYWVSNDQALDLAVGNFGYYVGSYYTGVDLHLDYLWHCFGVFGPAGSNASTHLPLYFGVGGVYSSPNVSGARGVIGITYLFDEPFDVFLELAPTVLVGQVQGVDFESALGGRFYF